MFKRTWNWLKELPPWVWLCLFLISAIITTQALRYNNSEMGRLRSALYSADRSGEGVDEALNNLRNFVYGHMNTDLSSGQSIKPPVQLKYTYERLVGAEQERVNKQNEAIQRQAQAYCQRTDSEQYRETCFANYVNQRTVKVKKIPADAYKFDFASPTWSPDRAGWGIVISSVLLFIFLISLATDKMAARKLKHDRS